MVSWVGRLLNWPIVRVNGGSYFEYHGSTLGSQPSNYIIHKYVCMYMFIYIVYIYDPLTSFYGLIWVRTERFLVSGPDSGLSWVKTELKAKRIEYILEGNLLEKSVKRPFCCIVSILQVYFTYLCYITFWALEYHFIENLKLILKENQIMK